jgi:nitrate reductase NapAB chaperone NapD
MADISYAPPAETGDMNSDTAENQPVATVGAFARVDMNCIALVHENLSALEGITLFDLEDPAKVGLIIEASNLDLAYDTIQHQIRQVEGVLGVWPVYANFEEF